jgi:long-subunit acyl-CoA synthetase (AMP-forming)
VRQDCVLHSQLHLLPLTDISTTRHSPQIGSTATTLPEATKDPLWIKYIDDGMKAANKKTTSNAQIVQKWKLLPSDFTERGGELTPTMKLKRSVAAEKYSKLIEELYAEDER